MSTTDNLFRYRAKGNTTICPECKAQLLVELTIMTPEIMDEIVWVEIKYVKKEAESEK